MVVPGDDCCIDVTAKRHRHVASEAPKSAEAPKALPGLRLEGFSRPTAWQPPVSLHRTRQTSKECYLHGYGVLFIITDMQEFLTLGIRSEYDVFSARLDTALLQLRQLFDESARRERY